MKKRLIKLKLIQTKIYQQINNFDNLQIEDIEYRLKKSLQVIHKYHKKNKRILFISNSLDLNLKMKHIIKKSQHNLLSQYIWTRRLLTNKNEETKLSLHSTLEIKNDLIVILDTNFKNFNLKQRYGNNVPIIFLNDELNIFNRKFDYKLPGNFFFTYTKKKIQNYFFITLLKSALKKNFKQKKLNKKSLFL